MTIYCLGTSNFIVGSSFYGDFKNSTNEQVINLSVGASPSATGMYFLPGVSLAQDDIVIIDYAINDNSYVANGVIDADRIMGNLVSIISAAVESGAIPILLINPEAIGMTTSTGAQQMHEAVAAATGVPLLNLAELFRQTVRMDTDPVQLMVDDAHQSPHLASLIADVLQQAVRQVRANPPTIQLNGLPACGYRMIPAAPLVPQNRRVHRSSALRSADMAALAEGETLTLAVGETEYVRGLMLNFGAAGGITEVSGPHSRSIASLITHWDNLNPSAFMSVFVEFRDPVQGGETGVQIRVLPQGSVPTEPILHRRLLYPELYGEIQIEGVLIVNERSSNDSHAKVYDLLADRYYELATDLKTTIESAMPTA